MSQDPGWCLFSELGHLFRTRSSSLALNTQDLPQDRPLLDLKSPVDPALPSLVGGSLSVDKAELDSHYSFFCQHNKKGTLTCLWNPLYMENCSGTKPFLLTPEILLQVHSYQLFLKHQAALRATLYLANIFKVYPPYPYCARCQRAPG